ncbi:hypothetical protein BSKO_10259 [Bryopsis sp. KO-2023]|nr:hypothetical protein BSKO_10259 [Bryopsis sp. KO-2023]
MQSVSFGSSLGLGLSWRSCQSPSLPKLPHLKSRAHPRRLPKPVKAREDVEEGVKPSGTSEKLDPKISKTTDALVEMGAPIVNNLGFSGVAGLSVAIAIKVVGSVVAVVLGLGFVALQVLSYYGIIDIKWKVLEDNLVEALDVSGDGKVDKEDAKIILDNGLRLLSQGVPSVAGFCAGFLLGIKIF